MAKYIAKWNPNVRNSGQGAWMVGRDDGPGFVPNTDCNSEGYCKTLAERYNAKYPDRSIAKE